MISPQRIATALATTMLITWASMASAAVIAHESFDYTGTTFDGQGAAADGWGGAWTVTQNGPDNLASLGASSLSYPAGVALTAKGGSISNMSDEVAKRELATAINTNPASPREIWVSMLVHKDDTGSIDFGFERNDGVRRMVWGFHQDEKFRVNASDDTPFFATPKTFPVDTDLLVVVRMSLTNPTDTIALKVFEPGDAIVKPIHDSDFDVTRTGATGVELDRFVISGTSQHQQVDEIRIGDTFEDVAPVPEPGSLGLLGIGVIVLLNRRSASA